MASSKITSLLLPSGRTVNSRFKLPLQHHEHYFFSINKHSHLAKLLVKTDLINWDKAPMTHRHAYGALDKALRNTLVTSDSH